MADLPLPPIPDNAGDPEMKNYKLPLKPVIIPLKDLVVFPSMVVTVYVRNAELIDAIETSSKAQELIGVVTQKSSNMPVPPISNLYDTGTSAAILQVIKGGNDRDAMVMIEGISRFTVKGYEQQKPYLIGQIEPLEGYVKDKVEVRATMQEVKELIRKAAFEGKNLSPDIVTALNTLNEPDDVANLACSLLSIDIVKKQELLALKNTTKRLHKVLDYLRKEIHLMKIRKKIHKDISKEMNKSERDYLLKQELKAIKKELGDEQDETGLGISGMQDKADIEDLKKRIKKAEMPKEVAEIANKELDRLQKIIPISPEYTVARTYIEWLCDMPWERSCDAKVDVKKARKILDADHYGLDEIKERILEFLAVCQLNDTCGATILCFVGPPGVGKTSLGKSIAKALGRAFVHTSLGGIRDEADVRGHRRTYVGALPGRIIQSIKRADCNNPVFMLDEIDKVGKDFQGDPAAALLEALDPEQNNAFTDHYLDVPFDLSKVFFITTANLLDPIPPALLDRMEVIELPGYTEEEKLAIAKKYLLPKQLKANGLEKKPFKMTDKAILAVIRHHTSEAGLRELERQIGKICRKAAKDLIETKRKVAKVDVKKVERYLGVEKYTFEAAQEADMIGVATGLAWTMAGGDIIFIESSKMHGEGRLILTGNLGEVMQESAQAALSYVRSNVDQFDIDVDGFEKKDIHIHIPEGATPKDGPSAGITMCTSLISLMTGQKVRRDVAMTGEVTLTGRILPIGGLKEKLLAAKRAQIKTVIIPQKNKKDLTEIPDVITKGLDIKFADNLDDVVKIAIIKKKSAKKRASSSKKKKKGKDIKIKVVKQKKPLPIESKRRS